MDAMDRIIGLITAASAAVMLPVFASPALAADTAVQTAFFPDPTIPNVPGPAFAQFTIAVSASVGGTCGFAAGGAPSGTISAPAIDTAGWSGKAFFTPQCTAPWRIAVSSQNGALLNSVAAPTAAFTNRASYTVKLHVITDTGSTDDQCAVANLTTANTACSFEGAASAANGLQLPRSYLQSGSYIEATAAAYAGSQVLVAGTYQDVLTITVSPAT